MNSLRRFAFAALLSVCLGVAVLAQTEHSAIIPEVQLTFTTIDVPGAEATTVYGINGAGDVVGNYSTEIGGATHGFSFKGGEFALFDYPGGDSTTAFGINDAGVISGWVMIHSFTGALGFRYNGSHFAKIQAPGASATIVRGINNSGVVVGAQGSLSQVRGFESKGHVFKDIQPPGNYIAVFADGINNLGQAVGTTEEGSFLYSGGKYKRIAVPGAVMTSALGINDSGIIVGWYEGCSPLCHLHGFVLRNGKYLSFDYPGAAETFGASINNAGQIVGTFDVEQQTYHGFVSSPITAADFEQVAGIE
jgi:uncharacterized membrane protein